MLKATVSGSFHRHMAAIYTAVGDLRAAGVDVLSPSDPRIVDHLGEFLFVASDRLRSVKLVQDRHFEAIRASDFLWLVCPDGYTGVSASAEVGFAHAVGTPVFSDHLPLDITLAHYVRKASSITALVHTFEHRVQSCSRPHAHYLLDPDNTIECSIKLLEQLRTVVEGQPIDREAETRVSAIRAQLGKAFELEPGRSWKQQTTSTSRRSIDSRSSSCLSGGATQPP